MSDLEPDTAAELRLLRAEIAALRKQVIREQETREQPAPHPGRALRRFPPPPPATVESPAPHGKAARRVWAVRWRHEWKVLRHWRNWRREFRWARSDHHGHVLPDSARPRRVRRQPGQYPPAGEDSP